MNRAFLTIIAWALLCAVPLTATTSTANLQRQFRKDVDTFVRAKAQQPIQEDAVSKTVEAMVAQMESSFPGILAADSRTSIPTDDMLEVAYADLQRVGAGARLPVLVSFYAELWRAKRLESDQAVIFDRLMRAVTSAVEKQKNEKKG